MPTVDIDGITTRFDVRGSGPPLLMFAPGGFGATARNWDEHGIYRRTGLAARLREHYTCIAFDRRDAGGSGGRVERLAWAYYAEQGIGLLDHLGVARAHLIGGCVGCSIATTVAVQHPERTGRVVLFSPAGGARYRLAQHARARAHLDYVAEHGLTGVVALATATTDGFAADPRGGPWVEMLRRDPAFAATYAGQDPATYTAIVEDSFHGLFDRDSVPGPAAEDLMAVAAPALVVPGQDASHATSAAHFLAECLPAAQLWDVPVSEQTADTAPDRVLDFLAGD